jgi:hypothetical protein
VTEKNTREYLFAGDFGIVVFILIFSFGNSTAQKSDDPLNANLQLF